MNIKDLLNTQEFINSSWLKEHLEGLSVQEKRNLISEVNIHNYNLYKKLESKLNDFNFVKKDIPSSVDDYPKYAFKEEEEFVKLDISFYQELLNGWVNEEQLAKYLPRRINPNFYEIMNLLIANIVYKKNEIEKFILEEQLEPSYVKEFLKELKELEKQRELLIEFRDKKNNMQETEEVIPYNKLIYLTTSKNNIYSLLDIKQIPSEIYPIVLELLMSILDGNFKNLKTLTSNDYYKGLLQVKSKSVRIVFKRINKDIYLIIAIFVKKVQLTNGYSNFLKERALVYQANLEYIKQAILSEEYLEYNEQITSNILQRLKKVEHD